MERRENDLDRNSNKHLYRLGELNDYKVDSNDPDVRGWPVVDRDNREFGTISELIVDPEQEKVRYLDVVTNRNAARNSESEDHLLIPIGVARIADTDDSVIVRDLDAQLLTSYPSHRGGEITRDYEYAVVERFNRPDTAAREPREGTEFYNDDVYNEGSFYTKRDRKRGL